MLSSRRGSSRPILASCSTAHAAHDGLAEALLVLLPLWAQAFGLSLTQTGALKSAFYAAMSAGQIPFGLASERLGERRLLALGTLGTAVGWLLLAEADGFRALLLAVLVAGLGSSVQHPLASSLVSRAHRGDRARAALGVYNFAGDAGKAIVPALLAVGIGVVGWRMSSWSCGVAMAVVALGVHLSLQRFLSGEKTPESPTATPPGWGITHRRDFTLLSAIAVIDASSRSGFLLLAPFLMVEKGLPVEQVGFGVMLIFAGGAAGKFACGFLAERLGTVRTIVITEVATALGIVAAVAAPMSALWVLLAPIGLALNGTSSALYAAAGEFAHEKRQARAFGLFYTVTTVASAAAPIAVGGLGDAMDLATVVALVAAWTVLATPLALALRSPQR
ncbi:MAG: MFS transporter [Thiotrichales bacterium]|nr:MFS transporter [Thiotrichales bacterium]